MKISNGIKDVYSKLFKVHCPYCKSTQLKYLGEIYTYRATNYWWDLKDCDAFGGYHNKVMECLKCRLTHYAP
jgi:hypothetical protein